MHIAKLVCHVSPPPQQEGQVLLFGGEYYNGDKTFCYNDTYAFHGPSGSWTHVADPAAPPPRCSHQAVAYGQWLYLYGGEYTSPNQQKFHHYGSLSLCADVCPICPVSTRACGWVCVCVCFMNVGVCVYECGCEVNLRGFFWVWSSGGSTVGPHQESRTPWNAVWRWAEVNNQPTKVGIFFCCWSALIECPAIAPSQTPGVGYGCVEVSARAGTWGWSQPQGLSNSACPTSMGSRPPPQGHVAAGLQDRAVGGAEAESGPQGALWPPYGSLEGRRLHVRRLPGRDGCGWRLIAEGWEARGSDVIPRSEEAGEQRIPTLRCRFWIFYTKFQLPAAFRREGP